MDEPTDNDQPQYLTPKQKRADMIAERKASFKKAVADNPDDVEKAIEEVNLIKAEQHETVKAEIQAGTLAMQTQLSLEEQELARRVLARRSLLAFIIRFEPAYKAGWVHKLVCERLELFFEQVKRGESPRLMLFMPPRGGKSLIASHYFPAWALGHSPEFEFISTSYSSQLAESFSRKARGLLKDPSYHAVFKTRLDESTQAVGQWATTKKGGYVAAGVGGGITGKGANILIIDDPVRNQEDADSFTVREMQKGWYESTAYTRLAPGGGVLIIQTRWHLDDLSGWLEDKSDKGAGDNFEVIRFPAIAVLDEEFRKKGEALHPERYDEQALSRIERAVGPRTWAALYQQNPVPDDGVYFKKPTFHWYDRIPDPQTLRYYASWDLAIGVKEVNDFTVGIIWAVDPNENIYIINYHRGHFPADKIIDTIIDSAVDNKCGVVTIEKGQILMSIGPALNKSIQDKKAYSFELYPMGTKGHDKMLRARSIQARMQQGRVFFPKNFEGSEVHTEMLQFPSAKHDDFVDAMAYIGLYLEEAVPGTLPIVVKPKSWKDNLKTLIGSSTNDVSPMAS